MANRFEHYMKPSKELLKPDSRYSDKYTKVDPFIKGEQYDIGEYIGKMWVTGYGDAFCFVVGKKGEKGRPCNLVSDMNEKRIEDLLKKFNKGKL